MGIYKTIHRTDAQHSDNMQVIADSRAISTRDFNSLQDELDALTNQIRLLQYAWEIKEIPIPVEGRPAPFTGDSTLTIFVIGNFAVIQGTISCTDWAAVATADLEIDLPVLISTNGIIRNEFQMAGDPLGREYLDVITYVDRTGKKLHIGIRKPANFDSSKHYIPINLLVTIKEKSYNLDP